jgi:hypothetical protein
MDPLTGLQEWYQRHCDGEWEHARRITIESCDNPGWWVRIDIAGTELETRSFLPVMVNVDAQRFQEGPRWLCCHVENGVWNGAGDETRLPDIIARFLAWAQ